MLICLMKALEHEFVYKFVDNYDEVQIFNYICYQLLMIKFPKARQFQCSPICLGYLANISNVIPTKTTKTATRSIQNSIKVDIILDQKWNEVQLHFT